MVTRRGYAKAGLNHIVGESYATHARCGPKAHARATRRQTQIQAVEEQQPLFHSPPDTHMPAATTFYRQAESKGASARARMPMIDTPVGQ